MFVEKLDENGNYLWAKFIGGDSASVFPNDIALDSNNNPYITGFFYDAIDFNPGVEDYFLTPIDSATGMFILKLDTTGNFDWAKCMGGKDYYSIAYSIALDPLNNIYTTGVFSDTVDFDPGTGVFNLTNVGNADIFIQKLSQCGMIQYDIGNDTAVCEGSPLIINAGIENGTYVWQDNSTDSIYVPLESGFYSVTAKVGNCRFSDSTFITIDKPLTVDLGNDSVLCKGDILKLKAGNAKAYYQWQDNSHDSVFEAMKDGTYRVTVSNSCGTSADEINLLFENCECLFIPNSFTPNDDGINDYFSSVVRCDFSEYRLTNLDRWGERIFSSESPEVYWDGKIHDEYSSTGVYVYELSYRPNNTLETIKRYGHVSLIR
jgi:gliding motility-associated-like protein